MSRPIQVGDIAVIRLRDRTLKRTIQRISDSIYLDTGERITLTPNGKWQVSSFREPHQVEFYAPYEYVDLSDPRVRRAIDFVKENISICLERSPEVFLKSELELIPLTYYIPAISFEEVCEREQIIKKYKDSRPDQIEYYLIYHSCDEFAVLLWTILRSNGVESNIIHQTYPFHHTYIQDRDGRILDILLNYCNVRYPHRPEESQRFSTPHDFYAGVFIPKEDRREWEVALLNQLRELE